MYGSGTIYSTGRMTKMFAIYVIPLFQKYIYHHLFLVPKVKFIYVEIVVLNVYDVLISSGSTTYTLVNGNIMVVPVVSAAP